MDTECTDEQIDFQPLGGRRVTGQFNGGRITSDAGVLQLRELEEIFDVIERLAECFEDHRDPELVEHSLEELLRQRIFGLILGYEDLNDHDTLRRDPAVAAACGKDEPDGRDRKQDEDKGKPLAASATLNRLELGTEEGGAEERYKRIEPDVTRIEELLVELWLDLLAWSYEQGPSCLVLDADASDIQLHGDQEGRHYHHYYDGYCYLPLYVFQGEWLLGAMLRPSDRSAEDGCQPLLELLVDELDERFAECRVILRGDSDFSTPDMMQWCEKWGVDYVFGLGQNSRLNDRIDGKMQEVKDLAEHGDGVARRFMDFDYATVDSWEHKRRVVAKVEWSEGEPNPRYVVTSLTRQEASSERVYCQDYCGRGEAENRIKELQQSLFGTRMSTGTMSSNQLRTYFSAIAYLFICLFRHVALEGTQWAGMQAESIRETFLKIGALVQISTRRVWLKMASGYPYQEAFGMVTEKIRAHR
jgi:hypothetical protein